jgi:putative transposase
MAYCEDELIKVCQGLCSAIHAWCLLPNHYHLLVTCAAIAALRESLGQLHGRSSYYWNGEDQKRGRKVWHNCFERPMKSERHFWASLNYVHNNAVHHGYVRRWQDWPYSSGANFVRQVGRAKAAAIWREYPIFDYGAKWDSF